MYKIVISKKVDKFIQKHRGEVIIKKFFESTDIIKVNPFEKSLDTKPMRGNNNQFRLRIGKYRFIYEIDNNIITITFIDAGARGEIYK